MINFLLAAKWVGITIDAALIIAVLFFVAIGIKKGFMKSLLSLISTAIVAVVAIFSAKFVAKFLDGIFGMVKFFGDKITKMFADMGAYFTTDLAGQTGEAVVASADYTTATGGLFAPLKTLLDKIISGVATFAEGGNIANTIGPALGAIVTTIICGLIVFIVVKVIFAFLAKLFDNVSSTKTLGGMDKVLGMVFGFVKGVAIVAVLGCTMVMLNMVPNINNKAMPVIQNETTVTKFCYNYTDEFMEKYVVDNLGNWLASLY